MPVSRRRPPKWSYLILAAATLLLVVVVCRVVDRPSSGTADNALRDAASCGNIHFKSRPTVVLAEYDDKVGGVEVAVKLVVDVPDTEVGAFKTLSDLPEPTPGPQREWLESELKDSESKDKVLAPVLSASSPAGFQYVLQGPPSTAYSRLVVIQKTPRPQTQIYINTGCG